MIKLVMFDMDGVLFDSMPVHASSWEEALLKRGIQMDPLEIYYFEGATAMEIAAMFYKRSFGRDISPEYCREIAADKSRCVLAHGDIPLMGGAYDSVRAVKEAGVMPIVITGSSQPSLFTKLDRMFDSMLCADCMVTAFDVRKGKPDPEPYLTGMEKAGVGASEAIVVENSPLGVRSGKAAGAFTIAVNTGPLPDSALKEAGADMIFPSMRVLSSKIKDIISSVN